MRIPGVLLVVLLLVTGCGGSSGSTYPGGSAGKDVLDQHKYLDKSGRIYFPESKPKDAEIERAFCDYLFGNAKDVGETAKLKGTVTLDKRSGFANAGGSGIGFQCGYDVKGTVLFSLVLWTKKTTSEGAPKGAVIDTAVKGGLFGSSAYAPSYKKDRAGTTTLKAWLREASGRVKSAGSD